MNKGWQESSQCSLPFWMCLTDDFPQCSHTRPVVFHLILNAFPLLNRKCLKIPCVRAVKPALGVSLILHLTFFSTLSDKTIFASTHPLLMQIAPRVWSELSLSQRTSFMTPCVFLLNVFSSFLLCFSAFLLVLCNPSLQTLGMVMKVCIYTHAIINSL